LLFVHFFLTAVNSVLKNAVSKIRTISCDRPWWPWMTLNGVIAFILRVFHRIRLLCGPITSQWLTVDLCP